MPDPTLQQAIREAYASAPDDVIVYNTIEMRHPAFTTPIRVVANFEAIDARLEAGAPEDAGEVVNFLGFAFDFDMPSVESSGPPEFIVTIDNASREIARHIELAQSTFDPIGVTYRAYISTDLDGGPQNDPPLHFNLTGAKIANGRVTARAGFGDMANRRFPNQDYTAKRFPGLVR